MNTMKKMVLAFLASVCTGAAVAATAELSIRRTDGTYDFFNPNIWNTQAVPGTGDTAVLAIAQPAKLIKLQLTQDFSAALTGGLVYLTQASTEFQFDGDGHVLEMPESEAGDYASTPFYVTYAWKNWFVLKSNPAAASAKAVLKWTNPVFSVRTDESEKSFLVFQKGEYDFGSTRDLYVGLASYVTDVSFLEGSKLKAGSLYITPNQNVANSCSMTFSNAVASVVGLAINNGGSVRLTGDETAALTLSDDLVVGAGSGSATGTLLLEGGSFKEAAHVYLGRGGSGSPAGLIKVTGGSHSFLGGDGIYLGHGSAGTFLLEGGEVDLCRFRMGQGGAGSLGAGTYRQTGGTLRIAKDMYAAGISLVFAAQDSVVELDGGVTETTFLRRRTMDNAATAKFSADGGTLRAQVNTTAAEAFMSGLDEAKVGSKGLTVDNAGFTTYITQDFTDKDSSQGEIRSVGSGTVLYSGSYGVSRLAVERGEWRLVDASPVVETKLSLREGGTLSLVGAPTAVTLKELAVTNGVLALDPDDVITVDGPVALSRARIAWSSVPSAASPFLRVKGRVSDAVKAQIRKMMPVNDLGEGKHLSFDIDTYEEEEGYSVIKASVTDDVPIPEGDTVTWTGSGAWATGSNWSDQAAPTANQRAEFSSSSAGRTVSVAEGDVAGALRFDADGYALTGSAPLVIAGEQGAAEIAVNVGSQLIDTPLALLAPLAVPIESGASLEIAKSIDGVGIRKTGTGKLTLGAANDLEFDVETSDGVLSVRNEGALGKDSSGMARITGGTLEFNSADSSDMTVLPRVTVAVPAITSAAIFKTDTDVTLGSFAVQSGPFLKRGVGSLAIDVRDGETVVIGHGSGPTCNNMTVADGKSLVFPEDGTAPTGADYPAFAIAEGEMIVRGRGGDCKATLDASQSVIGSYPNVCGKTPELTLDNVDLYCGLVYLGYGLGYNANIAACETSVRILNGARLNAGIVQAGYMCSDDRARVTIAATNGTFQIRPWTSYQYGRSFITHACGKENAARVIYRFKDSRLYLDSGETTIGGGIDLDFDHSDFCTAAGCPVSITGEDDRENGTLLFRNGSRFAFNGFEEGARQNKRLTFALDDAFWQLGTNDLCDAVLKPSVSGYTHYEMRGKGAILSPASGVTYTLNAPLEGEGGLVKRGEGTVKFGPSAYAFAGTCSVEEGIVDFSGAGTVAGARFGGEATVANGTFTQSGVRFAASDDWTVGDAPTFSNCHFNGKFVVDMGRTESNPLDEKLPDGELVIGHWTGTTAPPTVARVIGTGRRNAAGALRVVNGEIRMQVYYSGLSVIVR